jgi:hypothetical protein
MKMDGKLWPNPVATKVTRLALLRLIVQDAASEFPMTDAFESSSTRNQSTRLAVVKGINWKHKDGYTW